MPATSSPAAAAAAASHSQRSLKKKSQLDSQNPIKIPSCPHKNLALLDIFLLFIVLFALGYLLSDFWGRTVATTKEALGITSVAYLICGIGFLTLCSVLYLVFNYCFRQKCDNPNCMGLRNAPEFDIKIETEDCLKKLNSSGSGDGAEDGFFEIGEDHSRELGAKLKKMAPLNGRAVLVFRAKCGCSAGKMVVWGQKKACKGNK